MHGRRGLGLDDEDAGLLRHLSEEDLRRNGVPGPEEALRRKASSVLVSERLASAGIRHELRISPLGAAWSSDLDVHLEAPLDPMVPATWGWLSLDPLLRRLGHPDAEHWAVVDGGRAVAGVDLHTEPPPGPVAATIRRCRRRREVRLREVLELRVLVRQGAQLPTDDPAVTAAADVEHGLGGDVLRAWRSGTPRMAPATLARRRPLLTARQLVSRAFRRPVVIAVSGVDGAGKSTVTSGLVRDLSAAGLPVALVWTRPGMGLGVLYGLARRLKALAGQRSEPVMRSAATAGSEHELSRRGVIGWTWTVLVTVSFLVAVRRKHMAVRGVVVYDRHIMDALATLAVFYKGVRLGFPNWLVRTLLPRADMTVYLDVSPEVAAARKPGDTVGLAAVTAQLREYGELLPASPHTLVVDASRPAAELQEEVLRFVLSGT